MCPDNQHAFISFAYDTFDFLPLEPVDFLKRVQRIMHNNVVSLICHNEYLIFQLQRIFSTTEHLMTNRFHAWQNKPHFSQVSSWDKIQMLTIFIVRTWGSNCSEILAKNPLNKGPNIVPYHISRWSSSYFTVQCIDSIQWSFSLRHNNKSWSTKKTKILFLCVRGSFRTLNNHTSNFDTRLLSKTLNNFGFNFYGSFHLSITQSQLFQQIWDLIQTYLISTKIICSS
jgi:hypothetical protein